MDYFGRPASSGGPGASTLQAQTQSGNLPPITPLGTPLQQQMSDRSTRYAPTADRPRGPSSVRLRRLPSTPSINEIRSRPTSQALRTVEEGVAEPSGRRRSSSEPQRPSFGSSDRRDRSSSGLPDRRTQQHVTPRMPALTEETSSAQQFEPSYQQTGRDRATSDAASSAAEHVLNRPRRSSSTSRPLQRSVNYERDVVDLLDVIGESWSTCAHQLAVLTCHRS